MRRNQYLITINSPQSVKIMDDDDDADFCDTNRAIFSVLRPSKFPTKERIHYLWKRVRVLIRPLSRLIKVWKDIQLYGGKRNHLEKNYARRESSELPNYEEGDSYLFSPNSTYIKLWSLLIMHLLIYTAVVVPYRISFIYKNDDEWFIADTIIDIIFFIDIFVTFNSAYFDHQMKLINSRRTISLNYLKSWFVIDLVSCIPFQLFIDSSQQFNKLVRISRVPRIMRIMRLFKILKFFRTLNSLEFIQNCLEFMNISKGVLRLLKFFFTVVLVVHINGCIWHFIGTSDDTNPDSWLLKPEVAGLSENELYLASIYFVMQTIATIGFGDILPVTMTERIYTLLLLLIGVGFYSYIVGNLSNIFKVLEKDNANIKLKLSRLQEFAKDSKIPQRLKDKIKRHIEMTSESGIQNFDKASLIKELPASLKNLVQIHIHKKIVERIFFFQDKDEQFISRFVGKLKTLELSNSEIIFSKEDYADEVYFISKGRIIIKGEFGGILKNYLQGSYFGELEVLSNSTRKFTAVVASATAILLIISKRDFMLILKEFPEILREVKTTAKIREQKINESACELIQTFINNRGDLSKSKTSHDNAEVKKKDLQVSSRQSWKNFLKNNLGIEAEKPLNFMANKSVWDNYQDFRNNKDLSRKFVQRNSLTELFDRAGCVIKHSNSENAPDLTKENFSKPLFKVRNDKKVLNIIEPENTQFEVGDFSPEISSNESRDSEKNEIVDMINELLRCQRTAEAKLFDISMVLENIYKGENLIRQKLEIFLK